jgi:hypothetical protein
MEHEKQYMGLLKVSNKLLVPVYFRNVQNIFSKSSNVHNLCQQIVEDGNSKQIIAISLKITTIHFTMLLTQVAYKELRMMCLLFTEGTCAL